MKLKNLVALVSLLLVVNAYVAFVVFAAGTIRYVSTTGNNANSCAASANIDTPKLTFASALTCMAAGDTMYLRGGTYPVTWSNTGVLWPSGTSWTNAITIASYPGEIATVRSLTLEGTNPPHYIIFDRIKFDGSWQTTASSTSSTIDINQGAHHLRFQNCEITGGFSNGVILKWASGGCCLGASSDFNEFINCEIHHNGRDGSSQPGGVNTPGPNTAPGDGRGHALYITTSNNLFMNNNVHDNGEFGIKTYGDGFCSTCAKFASNNLISGNVFFNNGRNTTRYGMKCCGGILLGSGQNNRAINNIIYGNNTPFNGVGHLGIQIGNSCLNCLAYNNTIYRSGRGTHATSTATNAIFKNNIILGSPAVSGVPQAYINQGTNTISDHNGCGTTETCGTNKVTLAAITTCTVSATDFRLINASPCGTAGVAIAGFPFNGAAPPIGALYPSTFASGTVNENFCDVTIGMNLHTPIQVGGIGEWNCAVGGVPRTTTNVARFTGSSSIARITFAGAPCVLGEVWTANHTYSTASDFANVGGTVRQPVSTFTGQPVANNCGTPPPPPPSGDISYDFNENTGTTAADGAGGDQPGILTNTPSWVAPGKEGASAVGFLAGSNQYVAVPLGNGYDPTANGSADCMWVKPDVAANQRIFFGTANGASQRYYMGFTSGTLSMGIKASPFASNPEFTITADYVRACIRMDSATDTATLFKNGVKGTSSESVKVYGSGAYTFASDLHIGLHEVAGGLLSGGTTIDGYKHYATAPSDADMLLDFTSSEPPSPPASGTLASTNFQVFGALAVGGAAQPLAAVNTNASVAPGGRFTYAHQTDCSVTACSSLSVKMYYRCALCPSAGEWVPAPDVMGPDAFAWVVDITDPHLLTGTVSGCLDGALTPNSSSGTQHTAAAVPVFTLAQDECVVQRGVFQIGASAGIGWTYCLQPRDQNGNELTSYMPIGGGCVEVRNPSASGFAKADQPRGLSVTPNPTRSPSPLLGWLGNVRPASMSSIYSSVGHGSK